MKIPFTVYFFFASLTMGFAEDSFASLVRETEPLTASEELGRFHVPAGFKIQLIAAEPVINKPVNLAVDAAGNLWVTSSREYPFAIPKDKWATTNGALTASRDKIVVFKDSDGDHVPDQPNTFVDNLNVPTGVLPYGKGCIAWSIPNIWYFADNDGDGKCDERKILFGPLGWEKDTHGNLSSFRLAPDGWIYATHGFSNQTRLEVRPENAKTPLPAKRKPTPNAENWVQGADALDFGLSLELHSGNVFRFRPDGSAVEPWAWGQVNPFGLTWDSHGNLYSADCHSNPLTQIIRGAYYPSFGKPHDGLGFGPVLCSHSHGSTGICGPLYLHSDVWGAEFNDHLLVCNPVTSRINHDLVSFTGATPKAIEQPDFLTTEDPWFRPVDIQLAGDGSLYIADFYNKIIGHYEVPLSHPGRDFVRGRIWRLVKEEANAWAGNKAFQPATGAKAKPQELAVRLEKMQAAQSASVLEWMLQEMEQCSAEDLTYGHHLLISLREALRLPDGFAQLAKGSFAKIESQVATVVRTMPTQEAAAWLLSYLERHPSDPAVMRETLSQLARRLPPAAEPKLISMTRQHLGTQPQDQLTMLALLAKGIQQRGGDASPEATAWAESLAETLLQAAQNQTQPDWSIQTSGKGGSPWKVETRKTHEGKQIPVLTSLSANRGAEVERLTATLVSKPFPCPQKLQFALCGHRGSPGNPAHELNLVRLVDAASGSILQTAFPPRHDDTTPITWDVAAHAGKSVRLELIDQDTGDAYAWLAMGDLQPPVVSLTEPGQQSLITLAALITDWKLKPQAAKLAGFWEQATEQGKQAILRAVATAPDLSTQQAQWLKAAPSKLQISIAENLANSEAGATALCDSGPAWLLKSPSVAAKLAALSNEALKKRIATLAASAPEPNAEIAKVITARIADYRSHSGDARHGQQVFVTNCSLCHRAAGVGAVVGPQLEGAGNRGLDRLCEDILDPNREVDPAFQLRILTLKDKSIRSGLLRRQEGDSIILADATGQESTVSAKSVEQTTLSPLSLMPAAFHESIPPAEFRDLLAWLLSLR